MIGFNTGRLWKANRVLRGYAVVQAIRAGLGASYVRPNHEPIGLCEPVPTSFKYFRLRKCKIEAM